MDDKKRDRNTVNSKGVVDGNIEVAEELRNMGNFTMIPNPIIRHPDLSANEVRLWAVLYSYFYGNNKVYPGMARLANDMNCSDDTVLRARKKLEEMGLVSVERRGDQMTNLYTLSLPKEIPGNCDPAPMRGSDSAPAREKENRAINKTEKEEKGKTEQKEKEEKADCGYAAPPPTGSKNSITETPEDLQLREESNHNKQKSTVGIKDKGDWVCQNCMYEHHSHVIADKNCRECGHPLVWVTNEEQYDRIRRAAKEVKKCGGDFSKYCAVPSWVLRSGELKASQKVLVGTIISKCISIDNEWCTMRNGELAKKMGLKAETISAMLSDMASKGFIKEEYIYTDRDGNRIEYKSWDSEQPLVLNGLHLVERRLSVTKRDEVDAVRGSSQKGCGKIIHTNQEEVNKNRRNSNDAEWSKSVHERDNYTCKKCGDNSTTVDAHHIEGYANNEELRTSIDNGITLCKKHHTELHRLYGYDVGRENLAKFMEDDSKDKKEIGRES